MANFEYPSILDLKMGTRTYGDDETDAKKMRKRQRAANSTSKLLGVRLHGMQVGGIRLPAGADVSTGAWNH